MAQQAVATHDAQLQAARRGETFSLEAALFWTALSDAPDPAEISRVQALQSDGAFESGEKPASPMRFATANVCTFRPAEEALPAASAASSTSQALPTDQSCGLNASGRRLELAEAFAKQGVKVIGIQEARTRWARRWTCRDFHMISSGATPTGQ